VAAVGALVNLKVTPSQATFGGSAFSCGNNSGGQLIPPELIDPHAEKKLLHVILHGITIFVPLHLLK